MIYAKQMSLLVHEDYNHAGKSGSFAMPLKTSFRNTIGNRCKPLETHRKNIPTHETGFEVGPAQGASGTFRKKMT